MDLVMLLLGLNIPHCVLNARYGDAEGAIPFLPLKQTLIRKRLVNPLRRISFEKLNRFATEIVDGNDTNACT
jgi:hypothetical protein